MANTTIQLKYSTVTTAPSSLNVAEPAYSFSSNKLFIGNTTTVIAIGGKYYTDIVDAATNLNTADTLVKRDASGNFSAGTITAALSGNAATASKWQTARNIGVDGDATGIISVDGSANANIPVTLVNSGVTAGSYGGASNVASFTVDSKGRITSASNVAISSTLNIAGDTGTDAVSLISDTLTFEGGDGITSVVTNNKASFAVDTTVVRSSGSQTISGDLAISGNLVVSGNTVTQDVENIKTEDSLIQLAANNAADLLDVGFYGQYVSSGTKYTALIRDASDSGKYKLLTAGTEAPSGNTVNVAAYTRGTLDSNLTGGTVSGLSADIAVADGGTGLSTISLGGVLVGNGASSIIVVDDVATGSVLLSGGVGASPSYGKVGLTTHVSGTLPIANGGTNQTSFTNNQRVFFNGTSLTSLANTTTTGTGTLTTANTITSVTVSAFGELTAYTSQAIAISASQVTSGTLTVARGGTGATTFTTNGVLLGQGTNAITTASSSTEGHVLTINSSGVPTFSMISGGTF